MEKTTKVRDSAAASSCGSASSKNCRILSTWVATAFCRVRNITWAPHRLRRFGTLVLLCFDVKHRLIWVPNKFYQKFQTKGSNSQTLVPMVGMKVNQHRLTKQTFILFANIELTGFKNPLMPRRYHLKTVMWTQMFVQWYVLQRRSNTNKCQCQQILLSPYCRFRMNMGWWWRNMCWNIIVLLVPIMVGCGPGGKWQVESIQNMVETWLLTCPRSRIICEQSSRNMCFSSNSNSNKYCTFACSILFAIFRLYSSHANC